MNIIIKYGGNPQFSPQFVCAVYEIIALHDGACERGVVEKFLAPASPDLFQKHLAMAINLGLFTETEGIVSIPKSCSIQSNRLTPKTLSRFLCEALFPTELPKSLNSLQALFLWAYSLRPCHEVDGELLTAVPKKWEVFEVFASATGLHGKDRVFNGSDQFPSTRRWLEAMGVMVDVGKDTYLLSHELAIESFKSLKLGTGKPIRGVIEEFREICPYLPGGRWNRLWMGSFTSSTPLNTNAVSQVTKNEISEVEGVALTYLQNLGLIRLEDRNDAPDRMRLSITGNEGQMLSHVRSLEEVKL